MDLKFAICVKEIYKMKTYLTAYCCEMFQFDLPSAILKKRSEKFDSISFNWHYIELLVKIVHMFWVCFLFHIMYASTYERIKKVFLYKKIKSILYNPILQTLMNGHLTQRQYRISLCHWLTGNNDQRCWSHPTSLELLLHQLSSVKWFIAHNSKLTWATYTTKVKFMQYTDKPLSPTSRENIWNTWVLADDSWPLTAETGNCRNRHGRHWVAFCTLAVSALSQHRWRYGRPINNTYTQ